MHIKGLVEEVVVVLFQEVVLGAEPDQLSIVRHVLEVAVVELADFEQGFHLVGIVEGHLVMHLILHGFLENVQFELLQDISGALGHLPGGGAHHQDTQHNLQRHSHVIGVAILEGFEELS